MIKRIKFWWPLPLAISAQLIILWRWINQPELSQMQIIINNWPLFVFSIGFPIFLALIIYFAHLTRKG